MGGNEGFLGLEWRRKRRGEGPPFGRGRGRWGKEMSENGFQGFSWGFIAWALGGLTWVHPNDLNELKWVGFGSNFKFGCYTLKKFCDDVENLEMNKKHSTTCIQFSIVSIFFLIIFYSFHFLSYYLRFFFIFFLIIFQFFSIKTFLTLGDILICMFYSIFIFHQLWGPHVNCIYV